MAFFLLPELWLHLQNWEQMMFKPQIKNPRTVRNHRGAAPESVQRPGPPLPGRVEKTCREVDGRDRGRFSSVEGCQPLRHPVPFWWAQQDRWGGGLPWHHLESTALGVQGCRSGAREWDGSREEHAGRMQTVSVWPWARVCPLMVSWKSGLRGPWATSHRWHQPG